MRDVTTLLVKVAVAYDPDVIGEREAQERFLEDFPSDALRAEHVEIVAGLVDFDGVPVQERVAS